MPRSLLDPDELQWLIDNPAFDERPATLLEFLGPDYLNIEARVRPAIKEVLIDIFGTEVSGDRMALFTEAMVTGGIGIGKTTVASIVLPYMAHWVLCLKDPQGYFDLLPGSRIAFMQMSTSETQAKEVVFGDIKARIDYSPWFTSSYNYDRNFKNQIRFDKEIWILPGDSAETTFEGYNILGGILDEADSHKVTKTKDYADQGYTTISSRIASRFGDRGFLLVIGQMKKGNGFAAKKYAELKKRATAYVKRMAIWESLGWEKYTLPDGTRDSFWYDSARKEIVPHGVATMVGSENLIEVPTLYRAQFENNPEKALRDLAGIPPATGSPFISLTYKVTDAVTRWEANHEGFKTPVDEHGRLAKWFVARDSLKRVIHIDMAFSGDGDGLGLVMGHVPKVVEVDGEYKPYICIDLLMRVHAPAGREIFLGDIRRVIYELRDGRKFNIKKVTMDGFQSTDTRQQLERRRIPSEIVSVDKQLLPYYDLREAFYEDRIEIPRYVVRLRNDDTELTEIAVKELTELVDEGAKIDHPSDGSKDVADAIAGVTYTLMGDRQFRRKVVSIDSARDSREAERHPMVAGLGPSGIDLMAGSGMRAPLPPDMNEPIMWDPKGRR